MISPNAVVVAIDEQLPPHGAVVELLAFRTDAFSSTTLSDTIFRKMPLKQLWWETTCCTLGFRGNARGPEDEDAMAAKLLHHARAQDARTRHHLRFPSACIPTDVGLQNAPGLAGSGVASGSPGPVIVIPFSRNVRPDAPKSIHGPSAVVHVTLPTSWLSS
jgi:hypothetical protein